MIQEPPIRETTSAATDWRQSGLTAAASLGSAVVQRRKSGRPHKRQKELHDLITRVAADRSLDNGGWLLDHIRLAQSAEKETREFIAEQHTFPVTADGKVRVCAIAAGYLDQSANEFNDADLATLLNGFEESAELTMGEIWALRPALQLELLDRLLHSDSQNWPAILTSLRRVNEAQWKEVFQAVSAVERILSQDPAGAYAQMDAESRDLYRRSVARLAKHGKRTESQVAEAAVEAARNPAPGPERRAHVGYYLVDRGLPALKAAVGYRPPFRERVINFAIEQPNLFYLGGIELLTLAIAILMLSGLESLVPISAGVLLLLIPATQAAVEFLNNLVTSLMPPRVLPKLDFSEGIPADCATLVAVPTLLVNEAQVHDLVLDLEIRFLANRDPNIYFALVTDWPDADQPSDERDSLVDVCSQLIEGLNQRRQDGDRSPFLMLHRHRAYNDREGRWMGWERKRGKLLDLNNLLRGGFDAFPIKVGDTSVLPRIRYVITLDSDTQLPRDAARKLVGAMAHPLNRPVVHPHSRIVVEGYGIIQPRIGISVQSAARSRLAALYSGQTGFDIYTRAVSDVYQDLFGEGIFTGKGICDVDALREVMERRFPENALLSHDLIEGAYARVALATDIELIDDYPSHLSAYNRRKHRWVRGDWQILGWIRSRVPNFDRQMTDNPISLISRWKILDNLRRSLLEPGLVALFLAGWLYLPGPPAYWTSATLMLLFLPIYGGMLFAFLRMPLRPTAFKVWFEDTMIGFAKNMAMAVLSLIFLLHQALLAGDAIVRSIGRVLVTQRKMLEWETAAEAEATTRRKAKVDVYLEWTPVISAAVGAAVWLLRPTALLPASPVLGLWFISPLLSYWLNRQPRTDDCELDKRDRELMYDSAEKIVRYFRDWSSPSTHWLIPDSVTEDGAAELRLSPTNAGMLLNARIAAVHLQLLPLSEFVVETRASLDTLLGLPKYRGHLFNWYDINTLQPMPPNFVSTVDSGNFAASLWTLKQAALCFAGEPPARRGVTRELAASLKEIAADCDRMVDEMDFGFLFHRRKKVLSVGYDASADRIEPSCYDLLATEARIAVFIAIAKGDISQEAWFHLGRAHTLFRGDRILTSWTGTMFEYLMPELWMRHHPGTLLEQSTRGVVRAQREFARRRGVPWGISESACALPDGSYGYAPFGLPELAMKRTEESTLVISPYSSFLAAGIDGPGAARNLRAMEDFGWTGRYGFFESADYRQGGAVPIRSWMAHHQGMSLLAIVNLLHDSQIRNYFHAEPHVLSTELLLHERVPAGALSEVEPLLVPPMETAIVR